MLTPGRVSPDQHRVVQSGRSARRTTAGAFGAGDAARTGLLAVLVLIVGAVAGCDGNRPDEAVHGSAWRTTLRTAVGAATPATPARLTAIDVEDRGGFDRVTFGFDGPLPGFRVAYRPPAEPTEAAELSVLLQNVRATGRRRIKCDLPAIDEVRREPSAGEDVETTVTVARAVRLPFRIGITLGAVYVDVAHPGETGALDIVTPA